MDNCIICGLFRAVEGGFKKNRTTKGAFGKVEDEIKKILADPQLNEILMDILPYPVMLIKKDRTIITANKTAREMGVIQGSLCWDTFGKKESIPLEDREYFEKTGRTPPNGTRCTFCLADKALDLQISQNEKIDADKVVFDTYWIPISKDIYLHYAVPL